MVNTPNHKGRVSLRYKLSKKAEGTVVKALKLSFAFCVFSFSLFSAQSAQASICCFINFTSACAADDCQAAVDFINERHDELVQNTQDEFDDDLEAYEDWLIEILLNTEVVPAMAAMATQMGSVAMQYTQIIGGFLDAQAQMDTQRLLRKLQFEAHKDYIPSETFCHFGTNVRSLASAEERGRHNALVLSKVSLARQVGTVGMGGDSLIISEYEGRWWQFVPNYCDPTENNFLDLQPASPPLVVGAGDPRTGLMLACDNDSSFSGIDLGANNPNRYNRDISYTRLMDKPRTLNLDFTDTTLNVIAEPLASLITGPILEPGDEEDVIAMSKNLYGNRVLSRGLNRFSLQEDDARKSYLILRSVAAKRSVAQATFNAMVALKSSGSTHEMTGVTAKPSPGGVTTVVLEEQQTRRFLAAIVEQLLPADPAITAGNIFDLIGYSPSYYSQLEILAKRIYQNPDFYAQLYDSPANVVRKKVAMKAIELMVDRAIFESQMRREMSISVLLASRLRSLHRGANRNVAAGEDKDG